jgi:hypothetical protein
LSGLGAIFRLSGTEGLEITVQVEVGREVNMEADIVFRYLKRLGDALVLCLERLTKTQTDQQETDHHSDEVVSHKSLSGACSSIQTEKTGVVNAMTQALRMNSQRVRLDGESAPAHLHTEQSVSTPVGLSRP